MATAAASPIRTFRWTSRASNPRAARAGRSRPRNCASCSSRAPQIRPSQGDGSADGDGMYLTQLTGKQLSELEQMREQLGEIGSVTGQGRLMIGRGAPGFLLRLRRMGLRAERLPPQLVPAARNSADRRRGRFFREHARSLRRDAARRAAQLPAHPPRIVPDGPRTRGRRGNRHRSHHRGSRGAPDGRDARRPRLQGAQERGARRRHAVPARHVGFDRRADPSRAAQAYRR